MDRIIKHGATQYYRIPLAQPLVDAEHGEQTHFEVVTVDIELNDGSRGTGYTYTGGIGGRSIYSMIHSDLIPFIVGRDATAVENVTEAMINRVTYVGKGGISSFAISAVDIALWDLRCKHAGLPLWKLLGGSDNRVACYYGGIDLGFSEAELLESIKTHLADGHTAIKIKLGKEDLSEDLERVGAVRDVVGPDADFMVDANASWTIAKTLRAAASLKKADVLWLEEPLNPRDFDGYAELNTRCDLAIAMGENLHSENQHLLALRRGSIAYPQPDASNVCGITGWLRVANLAKCFQRPVCSHGMQELHVSLLAAMPHAGYMEIHSFAIDRYTKRPLTVAGGITTAPDSIGVGVEFDLDRLACFQAL